MLSTATARPPATSGAMRVVPAGPGSGVLSSRRIALARSALPNVCNARSATERPRSVSASRLSGKYGVSGGSKPTALDTVARLPSPSTSATTPVVPASACRNSGMTASAISATVMARDSPAVSDCNWFTQREVRSASARRNRSARAVALTRSARAHTPARAARIAAIHSGLIAADVSQSRFFTVRVAKMRQTSPGARLAVPLRNARTIDGGR